MLRKNYDITKVCIYQGCHRMPEIYDDVTGYCYCDKHEHLVRLEKPTPEEEMKKT